MQTLGSGGGTDVSTSQSSPSQSTEANGATGGVQHRVTQLHGLSLARTATRNGNKGGFFFLKKEKKITQAVKWPDFVRESGGGGKG